MLWHLASLRTPHQGCRVILTVDDPTTCRLSAHPIRLSRIHDALSPLGLVSTAFADFVAICRACAMSSTKLEIASADPRSTVTPTSSIWEASRSNAGLCIGAASSQGIPKTPTSTTRLVWVRSSSVVISLASSLNTPSLSWTIFIMRMNSTKHKKLLSSSSRARKAAWNRYSWENVTPSAWNTFRTSALLRVPPPSSSKDMNTFFISRAKASSKPAFVRARCTFKYSLCFVSSQRRWHTLHTSAYVKRSRPAGSVNWSTSPRISLARSFKASTTVARWETANNDGRESGTWDLFNNRASSRSPCSPESVTCGSSSSLPISCL
mmetsp:Transcript_47553/g.132595  ORF Transcript_47553/g.132595 Transcript_47553/m.132595 type:complete len:322 (-) Transcript_47553:254-1219(-)